MTTSAFSFLNGRTSVGAITNRRRRQARPAVRRRSGANPFTPVHRERDRRDGTDAYLDRTGMSSVDWLDGLTRQAQR
jgi:hypothetical protein